MDSDLRRVVFRDVSNYDPTCRTESGLYYSYFKQYVEAPDFTTAMHRYTRDNKTEFPNEVNILERFNIYQEFFLGVIYKIIKPKLIPIIWYSYQGTVTLPKNCVIQIHVQFSIFK